MERVTRSTNATYHPRMTIARRDLPGSAAAPTVRGGQGRPLLLKPLAVKVWVFRFVREAAGSGRREAAGLSPGVPGGARRTVGLYRAQRMSWATATTGVCVDGSRLPGRGARAGVHAADTGVGTGCP